jgi:hypothetical protein
MIDTSYMISIGLQILKWSIKSLATSYFLVSNYILPPRSRIFHLRKFFLVIWRWLNMIFIIVNIFLMYFSSMDLQVVYFCSPSKLLLRIEKEKYLPCLLMQLHNWLGGKIFSLPPTELESGFPPQVSTRHTLSLQLESIDKMLRQTALMLNAGDQSSVKIDKHMWPFE